MNGIKLSTTAAQLQRGLLCNIQSFLSIICNWTDGALLEDISRPKKIYIFILTKTIYKCLKNFKKKNNEKLVHLAKPEEWFREFCRPIHNSDRFINGCSDSLDGVCIYGWLFNR